MQVREFSRRVFFGAMALALLVSVVAAAWVRVASVFAVGQNDINYQLEERDPDGGSRIAVSKTIPGPDGSVVQIGYLTTDGTLDLDPTSGTDNLEPGGTQRIGFIRFLGEDGTYDSTFTIGDGQSGNVYMNGIFFSNSDTYVTVYGQFTNTVNFDPVGDNPDATLTALSSGGDAFAVTYALSDFHEVAIDHIGTSDVSVGFGGDAVDPDSGRVALSAYVYTYDVGGKSVDLDSREDIDLGDGEWGNQYLFTPQANGASFVNFYNDYLLGYQSSTTIDDDGSEGFNHAAQVYINDMAFDWQGYLRYAYTVNIDGLDYDDETEQYIPGSYHVTLDDTYDLHDFTNLGEGSEASGIVKYNPVSGVYNQEWYFDPPQNKEQQGVYISSLVMAGDVMYYAGGTAGNNGIAPNDNESDVHSISDWSPFIASINGSTYQGSTVWDDGNEAVGGSIYELALDSSNNVYSIGSLYTLAGPTAFDINPGILTDSQYVQDENTFIAKFDANLEYQYGSVSGSNNSSATKVQSYPRSISVPSEDTIYVSGLTGYEFQTQDPDTCEIDDGYVSGSATAVFNAAGQISPSDWWDFNQIPDTYRDGCDSDNDGISDVDEAAVPYDDANGDGTNDNQQQNVATLISPITAKSATIAIDDQVDGQDCKVYQVSLESKSTAGITDTLTYPVGLFDFKLDCGEQAGYTVTVKQYFYDPPSATFELRKVIDGVSSTYDAIVTQDFINGHNVLVATYQLTDNGEGDADTDPGTITDPAGPAVLGAAGDGGALGGDVNAPNTGLHKSADTVTVAATGLAAMAVLVAAGLLIRRFVVKK